MFNTCEGDQRVVVEIQMYNGVNILLVLGTST